MSFTEFATAAQMRDVIEKISTGVVKKMRPETRVAQVVAINNTQLTAEVKFTGDQGSINARYGLSLQPRAVGNIVRVAGKPGDYYITEILNDTGSHASYEPIKTAVDNGDIPNGPLSVKFTHIDYGAVHTDSIQLGAITYDKLADQAVTTAKIAPAAVTSTEIFDGAVLAAKLADGAVIQSKIGTGAVGTIQLADSAIVTAKIGPGAITETKIGDDQISTRTIAVGAITANELAANAVTANKLLVTIGGGNLLTNSNAADGTTGWSVYTVGEGFAKDTSTAAVGAQSWKVTSNAANSVIGFNRVINSLLLPNTTYTASAWVMIPATIGVSRVDLVVNGAGMTVSEVRKTHTLANSTWTRLTATFTTDTAPTDPVNIYIYTAVGQNVGTYFNAGAIQVEQGDVATSYSPKADEILPGTIVASMIQTGALVIGSSPAITFAVNYDPSTKETPTGAQTKADTALSTSKSYVQSRATDLVTNGTGLLGDNTNFTTYFDANKTDAPSGANLSFYDKSTAGSSVFIDELIAFDPSKKYRFSFQMRQTVAGATNRAYGMLAPYDAWGNSIQPANIMFWGGTTTTLAAALNNGDTTVQLTSGANWRNAEGTNTYNRSIIFWNWTDPNGKVWPQHTYSRNYWLADAWSDGGVNGNIITLKAPWAGGSFPAGHPVSNGSSGGSFAYMPSVQNVVIPETWTTYAETFSAGIRAVNTAVGQTNNFGWIAGMPPGTAKVKVGWLLNYAASPTNATVGRHAIAAVSLSDASAAQADATAAQTTASAAKTLTDNWVYTGQTTINGGKIQADTVTAVEIAGRTITANEISALTITGNELAAGSVIAGKVAAGAITAQNLTVAAIGDNLILNGNFRDLVGAAGSAPQLWGGGTWTSNVFGGATYGQVTPGIANESLYQTAATSKVSVNANDQFHISLGVGTAGGGHTWRLLMLYYDQSDTLLGQVVSTDFLSTNSTTTTAVRQSAVLTVPNDVNIRYVRFGLQGATAGVQLICSGYEVGKVSVSARIADGAITATKILAGAVTANAISAIIGGGNLIVNSNFSDPTNGKNNWTARGTAAASTVVSDSSIIGTQAIELLVPTTPVDVGLASAWVKVLPGEKFVSSAYVNTLVATTPTLRLATEFFDVNNAYISGDYTPVAPTAGSGWTRLIAKATAPANAAWVQVMLYTNTTAVVGDKYRFKALQIERGDVATSYAPKTDEILPGTVQGTYLTGDAIDGKMITGATFRTSATAATNGVQLNSNGLTMYQGGAVKLEILATGAINLNGTINAGSGTISGATISGGIVTGATVQTSNGRFKINDTGLTAYDSGGVNPTLQILSADGSINLKGTITSTGTISGGTIVGSTVKTASGGRRVELNSTNYDSILFYTTSTYENSPGFVAVNSSGTGTNQTYSLTLASASTTAATNTGGFAQPKLYLNTTYNANVASTEIKLSAGAITLDGPVSTNGTVTVTGNLNASGNVNAGSTSGMFTGDSCYVNSVRVTTLFSATPTISVTTPLNLNSNNLQAVNNVFCAGISATGTTISLNADLNCTGRNLQGGGQLQGGWSTNGQFTVATTLNSASILNSADTKTASLYITDTTTTTTNASNTNTNGAGGRVLRSTASTEVVKHNFRPLEVSDVDADKVLELEPEIFNYYDWYYSDPTEDVPGFRAERAWELGLDLLVQTDDYGMVETFRYDRLPIYHQLILRKHEEEIETLRNELDDIKDVVGQLLIELANKRH